MSDLINREDAIEVGNKIVEELALSSIDWDELKIWAKELFDTLPSADRHEYNLETIADIVRQLGHLDNYIADTYIRPNNKIHIQFENIFSDDCYFIEDDKYILAELEKIATDTEDCVEFTLTNNKKVIIHSADKPKGEWKTNNTYEHLLFCSEYGMPYTDSLLPRNYCPCCGADMRGEKNE